MSEFLPFHHVVNVRTLPRRGRSEALTPDAAAREAIGRYLDVESVANLDLAANVTPWKRDGVRVEGTIEADIVQACVVSLEPVESRLRERFEAILVPEGSRLAAPRTGDAELLLDADGDDPPETFEGDTIDLAAVWLEHMALAIDPFPRAPGAKLAETGTDERRSPFAALAALKPANDS